MATFALIGLYVGVLPVAIGLLWFPFLRRLSPRGMDFLLALTDWPSGCSCWSTAQHEGLEASGDASGVVPGNGAVHRGRRLRPISVSRALVHWLTRAR